VTVIGFEVSKKERAALVAITADMCTRKFPHPQDPSQFVTFLPPGAGVGTLVKTAVEQYVAYFTAVKQNQVNQAKYAQAAIEHSQKIRRASDMLPPQPGVGI